MSRRHTFLNVKTKKHQPKQNNSRYSRPKINRHYVSKLCLHETRPISSWRISVSPVDTRQSWHDSNHPKSIPCFLSTLHKAIRTDDMGPGNHTHLYT